MFVVLRCVEPEKKRSAKRRRKKLIERSSPVAYPTVNGLPFYILDVLSGRNGIDWESVCRKCGRYSFRIVASRSVYLPDDGRLKRFLPSSAAALFVFNTAFEVLKAVSPAPDSFCVTVTDRSAAVCSKICSLLPLCSVVRVVTSCPERYSAAVKEAFDSFGASLIVRPLYEPTQKPDIVICCDGCANPLMSGAAVFSAKRSGFGALSFYCSGIKLSERHESIIPADIESIDFCSAVTELCGSSEYKSSVFCETEISCLNCDDPSPEKCLACYCGGAFEQSRLEINT